MIPTRISGSTRNLGAPKGWDPERDKPCGHLPIRDEIIGRAPYMTSRWELTPDELDRVKHGAPVELRIQGEEHPVVSLIIADIPEDASKLHNSITADAVKTVLGPILSSGGSAEDVMVVMESLLIAAALTCIKLGGDDAVLDVMVKNARQRLAEIRLGDLDARGAA